MLPKVLRHTDLYIDRIYGISEIPSPSYIRHIWKTTELKKLFESSLDILDEMRSIRCIEHTNKARIITPFVGDQLNICDAFEIDIPDGCRPDYRSRRKEPKRRGRPRKPLTEREV